MKNERKMKENEKGKAKTVTGGKKKKSGTNL
jgi:hypothetical protein